MRTFLALLAAALLNRPGSALANDAPSVVITPPFIRGSVEGPILDRIVAELEHNFHNQGWRVVGLEAASRLPGITAGPCNNNACALAYAEAAHTTSALQVSVFGQSTVTFSVALVEPPNHAFVHGGTLDDPSQPMGAIAKATGDIIAQHTQGPGPWLLVRGTPIDAAVQLDGEVIGVVPLRRRITGGEHVLVVSASGHQDYNNTIWIENVAGASKEVQVHLAPSRPTRTSQGSNPRIKPKLLDWVVGSAAVATGLVYLASGIAHHAEGGKCLDEISTICAQRTYPATRANTQLAIGLSATAFGAGWLLVSPFGRWITPSVSRTDAQLKIGTRF